MNTPPAGTVPASPDEPSSSPGAAAPYADLTPDRILDALDSIGLAGDGRMLSLNSYENRVYQIYLDEPRAADSGSLGGGNGAGDGPDSDGDGDFDEDDVAPPITSVVVKFYRPGRWSDAQIDEEHTFSQELRDAEVPVVAPLSIGGRTLHASAGHRFAVFERRGGRPPNLDDPMVLERIGRFMGRLHAVGRRSAFKTRPTLDVATIGLASRDWLIEHEVVPQDLRAAWTSVIDLALQACQVAWQQAPVGMLRVHGDNHPGNILWTDEGPHFVDMDDCRSGPAVQDLWMLLSGDREDVSAQLRSLLTGYCMFSDFDFSELRLIETLRTLRLIHYSAWLARRWQDPAFPAAFPWFGTQRYWQDRVLEMREQVAAMQEPPLEISL